MRSAAWNPATLYEGGQTITVHSELYQIPIFIRAGSQLDLGDLNKEWKDARAAAQQRPDLKALDAQVKEWFDDQAHQASAH